LKRKIKEVEHRKQFAENVTQIEEQNFKASKVSDKIISK